MASKVTVGDSNYKSDNPQSFGHVGGAEGTRTPNTLRAKQVLFQLSYSPLGPGRSARGSPLLLKR